LSNPQDRIRRVLEAPVASAILGLAIPSLAITVAQVLTGVADTALAARFTTAHLAALALVVPFFSLIQMVSLGGMGGAISSSVGRSLGAKDLAKARILVWQGVYLSAASGLLFGLLWWLCGRGVLELVGADSTTRVLAYDYGLWLFAPCAVMWCQNALSSALRGAGDVPVLVKVLIPAYLLQTCLAVCLTLASPHLGLAGLALGQLGGTIYGFINLLRYLYRPSTPLCLKGVPARVFRPAFTALARFAFVTSTSSLQTGVTLILTMSLASALGREAVAAYGVASRLEFLLVVLLSSLGTALVTVTSVNLGAKKYHRARRSAALSLVGIAFAFGIFGFAIAWIPQLWLHLFTLQPSVANTAAAYLHAVAWWWPLLGVGLISYFLGQGIGRPWPFLAGGTLRLVSLLAIPFLIGRDMAGFTHAVIGSYVAFGLYAVVQAWISIKPLGMELPLKTAESRALP
jgi:Na+-driven multidrug efflux pump